MECVVWKFCEKANWDRVLESITRGQWEGFKNLYEMLAVVDVHLECFYKRLNEVDHIVWGLVGRAITLLIVLIRGGMGKEDVGYICFKEAIQKWSTWGFLWGQMISGSVIYLIHTVKKIKSGEDINCNSLGRIRVKFFLEGVHKEYVAAFIKGLGGKIVARTLVSQV